METNEKGQLFSWSWDWQSWPLPAPILTRMGRWERAANTRTNPDQAQADPDEADNEGNPLSEGDLADLGEFAGELAHLIQPSLPDPIFRAGLKMALITAHEQNGAWRMRFRTRLDAPVQPWQVIATVPVLVGVAALIWRYHQRAEVQPSEAA